MRNRQPPRQPAAAPFMTGKLVAANIHLSKISLRPASTMTRPALSAHY
jgi:hypothetical protein